MDFGDWQARITEHDRWVAHMEELLGQLAQQTVQINASLHGVATGVSAHDAQMRFLAERIRQNEETHHALITVLREIRDKL